MGSQPNNHHPSLDNHALNKPELQMIVPVSLVHLQHEDTATYIGLLFVRIANRRRIEHCADDGTTTSKAAFALFFGQLNKYIYGRHAH